MGRVYFPTGNDIGVRTLSGVAGADYAGFRAPAEPAPRGASNPVTLGVAVSTAIESGNGVRYWGGTPIVYRPPVLPAPRSTPATPAPAPAPVSSLPIVVAQPPLPQPIVRPPVVPAPAPAPPVYVAPPPVSQQKTPTPVVTIPPSQPAPPLVTSGGGTASPNIAPAAPVPPPVIYATDPSGNIVNAQTGAVAVPAAQAMASGTTAASMNAAAAAPAASSGVTEQIAAWLGGSTPIGTWSVPNALLAAAVVLGFAFLESGGGSTARRR
jgi:hypothetical protein